jgi:putative transposase
MKTLKVDALYRTGYETFADVTEQLPCFIEKIYNVKRIRSALGCLSPTMCAMNAISGE